MYSISQKILRLKLPIYLCSAVAFVLLLIVHVKPTRAESGTKKQPSRSTSATGAGQRLYAEPIFAGANPFLFGSRTRLKLPVAAEGYSVVALRDQQKWQDGKSFYQAIFDGQLYWFATQREKDIFSAAPDKYAPVLGGDCIVSFAETANRIHGDPRFGVVHRSRIYFFASAQEQERFKQNAKRYAQVDLGNEGNCLVSEIDQQKRIQGLPATIAVVGGLRYYFAGAHQRAIFGAAPSRYGVKLSNLAQHVDSSAAEGNASLRPMSPTGSRDARSKIVSEKSTKKSQALANAKPLTDGANQDETGDMPADIEAIPAGKLAMEGYCPVSIRELGVWVQGNLKFQVKHAGKIYLLAGKSQQEKFQKTPQPYLPALGGDCLVTLIDEGQHVSGSVFHAIIIKDNNKIYLFVGPEEQRAFKANRHAYIKAIETESTPAQYDGEEEATAKTGISN